MLLINYRSTDRKLASAPPTPSRNPIWSIPMTFATGLRRPSAFMEKQLNELRPRMEDPRRLFCQFERELNVINPEEKTSISPPGCCN